MKITNLFLVTFLSAVFVCDYLDGKIYNHINLLGVITAAYLDFQMYGNLSQAMQGLELLVIFVPFCFIGGLGGGDVKMFAVMGMMLGFNIAIKVIVVALAVGVVVSLLRRQRLIRLGVFMPIAHIVVMIGGIG